jgi:branched-chain amino acid transport system ATP-binding protein
VTAPALLAAEDLAKSYGGVHAVRGVSLAVQAGEMVAMIGPNGAGKSTCFNLLSGQVAPDRGRIRVLGRDTTGLPPREMCRLGVGRTFQVASAFSSMSVRENVQTALVRVHGGLWRFAGATGIRHLAEAEGLLAQVGLGGQAGRPAAELAYGDLKRLDLALALAGRPALLLMDEPTAGMAPGERAGLMRLVSRVVDDRRIGVLFTEHDMDVVFGHADRVMVLDRGRLIAEGAPDAVRADPQVRAVYLGEGLLNGAGA